MIQPPSKWNLEGDLSPRPKIEIVPIVPLSLFSGPNIPIRGISTGRIRGRKQATELNFRGNNRTGRAKVESARRGREIFGFPEIWEFPDGFSRFSTVRMFKKGKTGVGLIT